MEKKENKSRNFIIARYWNDENNDLCVYTFQNQVQHGNKEVADKLLEYAKHNTDKNGEWKIFWISTDRD